MRRSVIPSPNTMNTQVSLGGSATPMDSLETSVFVWASVLLLVLSAMLAMQGNCVTSVEGIIDDDVDQSIRNLVSIGADAMNETDRMVLDIMTHKGV